MERTATAAAQVSWALAGVYGVAAVVSAALIIHALLRIVPHWTLGGLPEEEGDEENAEYDNGEFGVAENAAGIGEIGAEIGVSSSEEEEGELGETYPKGERRRHRSQLSAPSHIAGLDKASRGSSSGRLLSPGDHYHSAQSYGGVGESNKNLLSAAALAKTRQKQPEQSRRGGRLHRESPSPRDRAYTSETSSLLGLAVGQKAKRRSFRGRGKVLSPYRIRMLALFFFASALISFSLRAIFFSLAAVETAGDQDRIVLSGSGKKIFFVLPTQIVTLAFSLCFLAWAQIIAPFSVGQRLTPQIRAARAAQGQERLRALRTTFKRGSRVVLRRWTLLVMTSWSLSIVILLIALIWSGDDLTKSPAASVTAAAALAFEMFALCCFFAVLGVQSSPMLRRAVGDRVGWVVAAAIFAWLLALSRGPVLLLDVILLHGDAFEYFDDDHTDGPPPLLRACYFIICEILPTGLLFGIMHVYPTKFIALVDPFFDSADERTEKHGTDSTTRAAILSPHAQRMAEGLQTTAIARDTSSGMFGGSRKSLAFESVSTDLSVFSDQDGHLRARSERERYFSNVQFHDLLSVDNEGNRIGGSAAEVYLCTTADGATWAVKIMRECTKVRRMTSSHDPRQLFC
jgi:hypothetical protein